MRVRLDGTDPSAEKPGRVRMWAVLEGGDVPINLEPPFYTTALLWESSSDPSLSKALRSVLAQLSAYSEGFVEVCRGQYRDGQVSEFCLAWFESPEDEEARRAKDLERERAKRADLFAQALRTSRLRRMGGRR